MTKTFNLRHRLLSAGLGVLRDLGFMSRAANSTRRKNSLLILCYHGLSLHDEHEWAPHLYLTPDVFRSRLNCLREMDASVLPLPEALNLLQRDCLPARSVAITFDDGFYDFLHHGLPILSEFGYPATLYLTTHYCRYRLPVIDLGLGYILWKSNRTAMAFPEYGIDEPVSTSTSQERQGLMRRIVRWTDENRLNTREKDTVARQIAEKLGVDYGWIVRERMFQILSPEEVTRVAQSGIDIELHTHRHRTPREHKLFLREIEENRNEIRAMTGKEPAHFCYPSGTYEPEFFSWLSECGVRTAATCDTGLVSPFSDSMKLPRVLDINNLAPVRFESIVAGLLV